ncbi:hypothetical protein GCM10010365_75990 [Streptomyces poonensis]|uniref:Uncharacterized protein n=1 Tax=Streptomyces poonensis TaxID=68255 RepID=A0A918QFG8_9ACTN|nr:hypothetical protein GCM10010365_75990 [Streptomyces poonensis]
MSLQTRHRTCTRPWDDRPAGVRFKGNDRWHSQKHATRSADVQSLTAPDGFPL